MKYSTRKICELLEDIIADLEYEEVEEEILIKLRIVLEWIAS